MNLWPSPDELDIATPHQRERYAVATRAPVGILGGGPGRGKTWVTAQIIKSVIASHGTANIAVSTPTGKAAQRVNELLAEHKIQGLMATTIHRMLGVQKNGRDGRGWGFFYGRETALPARFVFVDEASMLDTDLASSLLAAMRPGTHLLFIGDFAQLPPVGHGAPLRDMIAAGLPYGELTEPMRNDGDIVKACEDVKFGRPYRPSNGIDIDAGHNQRHIEASTAALALGALGKVIRSSPPSIDRVWDIQILCAINEKGEISRKSLNTVLQNILNPDGNRIDGCPFRIDDKVICGTNSMLPVVECPRCNYGPEFAKWDGAANRYHCEQCDFSWSPKAMRNDFVANGEIGRVTFLDKKLMHVKFDAPARTVRVAGGFISDFELAYAITCHKSQGSQWPVIVVMSDDSRGADRVTGYEWHRTAWSRAQTLCFTIGKLSAIHRQCRKGALKDRKTFLVDLLSDLQPTT